MNMSEERVGYAHVASPLEGLTRKQLVTKVKIRDEVNKIQILTIGKENNSCTKSILLIGQSGSGKSTLLNALLNKLLGVQFEDDFRYSVKDETGDRQKKKSVSQTEFVTGYIFYHNPGMAYGCNFLIIDTPGLLDSRGKTEQAEIKKQVEFFLREEEFDVPELHCLAFVINGTTNRSQQYVRDVIHDFGDLFGKDTIRITNVLATHCDSKTSVKQVLEDIDIKYTKLYNFQNDCIYSKGQGMEDSPLLAQLAPIKWDYLMKQYHEFLEDLIAASPGSLVLSREAAIEKLKLEGAVIEVKNNIENKIKQMIEYQSKRELYDKYMECMENNKAFEGEETVNVKKRIPIEGTFTHAHNCTVCEMTCMFPCYTASILVGCLAFYGRCEACSCIMNKNHIREGTRILSELKTMKVTHTEMARRFEEAKSQAQSIEEVKNTLGQEINNTSIKVVMLTQKIIEHISRINRIVRNPKPKTAKEYYDDVLKEIEERIRPNLENLSDKSFLANAIEEMRIQE
ncbi:uncharacterized protein LOC122264444 [Penaeus japonicus]|uniref:uncharacterized protein LOC122264444 n=1 Tax=Penaeus japonicus TaxID=27405 RepID=UPI001C7154AF|nr:uncharacterized protein LOC122264444 [Penaeus japonicus]